MDMSEFIAWAKGAEGFFKAQNKITFGSDSGGGGGAGTAQSDLQDLAVIVIFTKSSCSLSEELVS